MEKTKLDEYYEQARADRGDLRLLIAKTKGAKHHDDRRI